MRLLLVRNGSLTLDASRASTSFAKPSDAVLVAAGAPAYSSYARRDTRFPSYEHAARVAYPTVKTVLFHSRRCSTTRP